MCGSRTRVRDCLQLEALWALTNLLSGNEHQTKQTMKAGVIPACVAALSVDDEQVCSKVRKLPRAEKQVHATIRTTSIQLTLA